MSAASESAQAPSLPSQVAVVYTPATDRGPLPGPGGLYSVHGLGLDSRARNLTQAVKRSFISEAPARARGPPGESPSLSRRFQLSQPPTPNRHRRRH